MEYCTGTVGARFGERFKSNKGEKEQECRGIHKVLYSQGVEEDEKEEVLCRTQKRQPKIKDAQEGRSAVKDKKKEGSKNNSAFQTGDIIVRPCRLAL